MYKSILIISPESWGINFVSKHHYALALSKRKNNVYFLNPPSGIDQLRAINENLSVVDYRTPIRGINLMPAFVRNFLNKILLNKILTLCGVENFNVVWNFDAYRFQNFKIFESQLSIYHAVDIHHSKLEKEAVNTADLVFSSSRLILNRLGAHKNCYKVNHGLASYFIDHNNKINSERNTIKVGYIGNLHYKYLDTKTLSTLINTHSHVEFHFIGPYSSGNLSKKLFHDKFISFLKQKRNVILYGSIPSFELPKYMFEIDVFLLCYTGDSFIAELSNPHKILEYLSTGKAVISHYIDEYKNKTALIEMATYNEEIPGIFDKVINNLEKYNHPDLQIARKEFARKNTYTIKLEQIEKIVRSL